MENLSLSLLPMSIPFLTLVFSLLLVQSNRSYQKTLFRVFHHFALISIPISMIGIYLVYNQEVVKIDLFLFAELGFSIRLDALSVCMFVMISLLGYIIIRYSINYLDGDKRHHIFLARLAVTVASVQLLVLSGNLLQMVTFWVATSVCLHYLLVFYRSRPQAIAAARKKFVVARLGDLSFLIAIVLIYKECGTGDLASVFNYVNNTGSWNFNLITSTIFIVLAALLKSAQFPTQSWLLEVVETPTPVSALLHAGLLNAGPFLIVRMSFLMSHSTIANVLLILFGGFTALYASVIFLTQPTIKVSLGYSSIAHMGFMLLICGFGVYTAVMLHLVAHSFYKAHAFLSSGGIIDTVRAQKLVVPKRTGSVLRVFISVLLASAIYALFCYLWGIHPENDFTLMATGAIIVMGLSQIVASAIDSNGGMKSMFVSCVLAFAVALSFFSLEEGAHHLLHSQIPVHYIPNFTIEVAVIIVLVAFEIVVVIQLIAPKWKNGSYAYKFGIHLRNSFYVNSYFDRFIGSLEQNRFQWVNLKIEDEKVTIVEESLNNGEVVNSVAHH